ncbi:MAG: peptide ABC transporter substrate-binding protein [Anaerolineales bacterium]|nr:peptide ABC transporter substrate-binding protein [Anaerolineales bacterium]
MRYLRWQLLIVIIALVSIGVLLLSQQSELPAMPGEVQPVTGGVYSEGLVGYLGRLNPVLDFYNPPDRDVNRLIYSSLVRFDSRGLAQLDLAESMGISRDGLVYNVALREDAVWHDGQPVTSADVLFTVELLRDENIPIPEDVKSLWNAVEVEALDAYMVQFRLPEPYSPFLDFLGFGILPEHLLGNLNAEQIIDADFNLNPIGSGPYQFEYFLVEDDHIAGVVLTTYPDYYGEAPFIDQVVFRYYPDSQSALRAYRADEVMGISHVTDDILAASLQEPGLNIYTGRLPQITMIFLNLDNPEVSFFQEESIRLAMLKGLNRQSMIDNLLDGQAIIAHGPVFPESWAYYPELPRVEFDPEQAIKILQEEGFTIPAEGGSIRAREDEYFVFSMLFPDNDKHRQLAEAVQRDWARLGIDVKLEPIPYEQLISDHLDQRIYEAVLVDLNLAFTPDPDPYPFWHQSQITGGQNYAKWDDRRASEYLEHARVTLDLEKREWMYHNFQVRFVQELPALPLFYPVYTYAVDSRVQGVSMGPLFDTSDRLATITSWFLRAESSVSEAEEMEEE